MKISDRSVKILLATGLSLTAVVLICCKIYFDNWKLRRNEEISGQRPFDLSESIISKLDAEANNGNCESAYKIGRYHLYSSLDLAQGEKYFRLAARCHTADALVGLITVLRKPENDAELEKLVALLKQIDPEKGQSAAEEVALRRDERTVK